LTIIPLTLILSRAGELCVKNNNYVTLSTVEDGREGLVE
jgi:hypothetical protein